MKKRKFTKRPPDHRELSVIDKVIVCTNSDCKLRKKGCKGFEGCPGFKGK
jgi:hypothetical protein